MHSGCYYKLSTHTAYASERPTSWSIKLHPATPTPSFVPCQFPLRLNLVLTSHQTNRRKPAVSIIKAFLKPVPPSVAHKSLTATSHLLKFPSIAEITHVHQVISTSVCSLKCTPRDEHVACLLCGNTSALNPSPLTSEIQFQALATSSGLEAWPGVQDAPQNKESSYCVAGWRHERPIHQRLSCTCWHPLTPDLYLACHGGLLLLGQVQEN